MQITANIKTKEEFELQRKEQLPFFQFQDHLRVSIITKDNFDQAFECFIDGYLALHPVFKCLQVSEAILNNFFREKMFRALEDRPYQQLMAEDTKMKKIVGVFFSRNFMDDYYTELYMKEQKEKTSKQSDKMRFKFGLDEELTNEKVIQPFINEIIQSGNQRLYQEQYVAVLPDYAKYGVFNQMMDIAFYIAGQLGVKGYVDSVFNKIVKNLCLKHLKSQIVNEIDLESFNYNGQYVFRKSKQCTCSLILTNVQENCRPQQQKIYKKFYNQLQKYKDQEFKNSLYNNYKKQNDLIELVKPKL